MSVYYRFQLDGNYMDTATKRLYFWAPGDHIHLAPIDMFIVAKRSVRENGINWLEPAWTTGATPDKNGLLLFTSKLDALIYTFLMNEKLKELWNVYSFNDVSVTEMMIDIAPISENYSIYISFGFSVDNKESLIFTASTLRTRNFMQDFPIHKEISSLSPVTLKFDTMLFKHINDYWKDYYSDYCAEIKQQNSLDKTYLMEVAHTAIDKIKISKNGKASDFDCISRYSISKQKWITSY